MSEKFSGVRVLTAIAKEMRDALIDVAGDPAVFDSRMLWLERAARQIGISGRMAKAIFYNECTDFKASVVEKLRAARTKKNMEDERLASYSADRYASLAEELDLLTETIRLQAPDLFRAYCDERRRRAAARR